MAASPGWVGIVAVLLLGVLLQFHVRQIVTSSVLYDDAFIATAAKNLAMGAGYASSYHGIDRFDPEISTGPVIVMPTALLISLLGNQYWVPGLAITILIWTTLLLLMGRLRPLGGAWHSLGIAVMAGGLIVFGTNEFGLLGELPAVFLTVLAFTWLADDSRSDLTSGIVRGNRAGTCDLREAHGGDCAARGAAGAVARAGSDARPRFRVAGGSGPAAPEPDSAGREPSSHLARAGGEVGHGRRGLAGAASASRCRSWRGRSSS